MTCFRPQPTPPQHRPCLKPNPMPCHVAHLPGITIHNPESCTNDGVQVATRPMSKCNQMSILALQPMSLHPCSSHLCHPLLNLLHLSIWYLPQSQDWMPPPIATCSTSSTCTHMTAVLSAVPERTRKHTESRNHGIMRNSHILRTRKPEPRNLNLFLFLHSLDPWSIILSYP